MDDAIRILLFLVGGSASLWGIVNAASRFIDSRTAGALARAKIAEMEAATRAELLKAEARAREQEATDRARALEASLSERRVVTDIAAQQIKNVQRIDELEARRLKDAISIGGLETMIVDLESTVRQQTLTIARLENEVANLNKELIKANKQLELANQQLTTVLYGQIGLSSEGHTGASDAVHAENKQLDAAAAADIPSDLTVVRPSPPDVPTPVPTPVVEAAVTPPGV